MVQEIKFKGYQLEDGKLEIAVYKVGELEEEIFPIVVEKDSYKEFSQQLTLDFLKGYQLFTEDFEDEQRVADFSKRITSVEAHKDQHGFYIIVEKQGVYIEQEKYRIYDMERLKEPKDEVEKLKRLFKSSLEVFDKDGLEVDDYFIKGSGKHLKLELHLSGEVVTDGITFKVYIDISDGEYHRKVEGDVHEFDYEYVQKPLQLSMDVEEQVSGSMEDYLGEDLLMVREGLDEVVEQVKKLY